MKIRYARPADQAALQSLYELCFPADGFSDYFFTRLFVPERVMVAEECGRIASAVHALPITLTGKGEYRGVYCFAVSTHPAFRGRGYASRLLRRLAEETDADFLSLIALEPSLLDFYATLGFRVSKEQKRMLSAEKGEARRALYGDIPDMMRLYERENAGSLSMKLPSEHLMAHIDTYSAYISEDGFLFGEAAGSIFRAAFACGAGADRLCAAAAFAEGCESCERVISPGIGFLPKRDIRDFPKIGLYFN